jgi:MFS family permease
VHDVPLTRTDDDGYPSPVYAWYVVVLLTLAYVVAFIDRQILALLVDPIRRDLGLSDFQMSWLLGLAFALFYTFLGLPIGRLADRYSRRTIVGIGIALWSVMTAACGLARTFGQLFVVRMGVGIGEATLGPSALSLISDCFPRERRGRPLAFYNMGVSLGVAIANIVGGLVIGFVSSAPALSLPLVGELRPWQTVFLWVGLPGLVIALLMLTIREPARRDRLQPTGAGALPLSATVAYLHRHLATYATHFVGLSVVTIIGYGFFFWIPTMFVRTWQWTIPQISLAYGLVILIGGPVGVLASGWLADHWYRAGRRDSLMRVCLYTALGFVPASVLAPLMPTPELALLMLVPSTLGGSAVTACGSAALMMITPNEFRAQVSALYYFVINLLGLTLGPSAVAMVTDFGFGDDAALRWSLAIVCAGAGAVALGFLGAHVGLYRARIAEVEGVMPAQAPRG